MSFSLGQPVYVNDPECPAIYLGLINGHHLVLEFDHSLVKDVPFQAYETKAGDVFGLIPMTVTGRQWDDLSPNEIAELGRWQGVVREMVQRGFINEGGHNAAV